VQKKVNMSGIPKVIQKYNIKYSNYFYYHWIQQSIFPKQPSCSSSSTNRRFISLPSRCTLKYILTAYTSTIDITLDWADFAKFYELFVSSEELKTYAFEHYLDLTHFLISWSSYKKHRFVLLVGPELKHLNAWKLRLGRIGLKWVHQCKIGPYNNHTMC
jgi:hypothetical protein